MSYHSQYKQDEILNEGLFKNKQNGIFVDIGVSDVITRSNSYFFEKNLNWTGMCIEPNPNSYKKLIQNRKCICVQGCAWNKTEKKHIIK